MRLSLIAGRVPGVHLILELRAAARVLGENHSGDFGFVICLVDHRLEVAGKWASAGGDAPRVDLGGFHSSRDKQVPERNYASGERADQLLWTSQLDENISRLIGVEGLVDVHGEGDLVFLRNLLYIHSPLEGDGDGRSQYAAVVGDGCVCLDLRRD